MFHETSQTVLLSHTPLSQPDRLRVYADERPNTLHCLVVDTNATIMRIVGQMLEVAGYQTDMAHNGSNACHQLSDRRYDLVVTELDIPEMDCITDQVKGASRDTRIVIMTRRCHAEVGDLVDMAVADAWLFKPFGWDELFSAVDHPSLSIDRYRQPFLDSSRRDFAIE